MSFIRISALLFVAFGTGIIPARAQSETQTNTCIDCHSSQTFSVYNDWTEREETRLMNPFYILDTVRLAHGVHSAFECIDCHSYEYETYPHIGGLKLEPMMTCIDCHGGDDTYADWQFDEIQEEFQKSVHFERHGEQFTCSKCHDQHYYRPIARTSSDINEIVEYSNNMCLSCHDNMVNYQLMAGQENPLLVEVHNWLPNQELHFQRVRCIECHTRVKDSLLVSHNVMPKEEATRNCVECHSANSMLQASLYKYQNISSRDTTGNIENILSNQHYVIGTYQSKTLNILFIVLFLLTLAGIGTHLIFRIIKK